MQNIKPSVICTTYNNTRYLELVIKSYFFQKYKNFELIIADDGSTEDTKNLVEKYQKLAPFPIKHVWHEDKGFRAGQIRNKGALAAEGPLLIFHDGDCIAHPKYVEDHIKIFIKNKNYLFMGRRVELGPKFSKPLNSNNLWNKLFSPFKLPLLFSDSRGYLRSHSTTNRLIRKVVKADKVYDLISANMSIPKEDYFMLNGFNEDYVGYYGEDGEFFVRARNNNLNLIGKKYFAVCYHLYHKQKPFTKEQEQVYFDLLKDFSYVECKNGIIKMEQA